MHDYTRTHGPFNLAPVHETYSRSGQGGSQAGPRGGLAGGSTCWNQPGWLSRCWLAAPRNGRGKLLNWLWRLLAVWLCQAHDPAHPRGILSRTGQARRNHRDRRDLYWRQGEEQARQQKLNAGRGTVGKTAVVGAGQRKGRVKATPVQSTSAAAPGGLIADSVQDGSTIYTDDSSSCKGLKRHVHEAVNHSAKEYVRGPPQHSRPRHHRATQVHRQRVRRQDPPLQGTHQGQRPVVHGAASCRPAGWANAGTRYQRKGHATDRETSFRGTSR